MATPIFEDGERVVSSGFTSIVLLLVMFLPLVWGVLDLDQRAKRGIVTGSSMFIGCFFLLVTSFVVFVLRTFGDFVSLDVGGVALFGATASAFITALLGFRDRNEVGEARLGNGARWLGTLAGTGVTVGVMLPPPDSFITFDELNFSFGDGFVQVAWLVFVAGAGGVAAVGFSAGRRWGSGAVFAGIAPIVWMLVNALFEFDRASGQEIGFGGVLRNDIHPLLAISTVAVVGVALVALVGVGPPPSPAAPVRDAPPDDEQTAVASPPASDRTDRVGMTDEADAAIGESVPDLAERRETSSATSSFGVRSMQDARSAPPVRQSSAASPSDELTVDADGSPFGPVVVFPDGRRHVVLGTLIVGRDPEALPTDEYPVLIATGVEDRRVSKTHLAIGTNDSGQLWVEDRHSTNGVMLTPPDATSQRLDPGRRAALPLGSELLFGGTTVHVEPPGVAGG